MNSTINPVNDKVMNFGYTGILKELNNLAREQPDFLHLSNCDPPVYGYELDDSILKKIDQLQVSKYSGYPSWNGDEDLRMSLSQRIIDVCKVQIPHEHIVLTYGVSEGFPLTFASLFEGKKGSVAIPDPSYIPLMIQVRRFSNTWFYPCREELGWNPDLDQLVQSLEKRPDTKAMVIITPNSPTGAVYSEKVLKELVNIAGQYNLVIITDEIYDSISFTEFNSPLKYAGDIPVVYLNGFSKVYRLPGYRLGYIGWYDPEEKLSDYWKYIEQLCKGRMGVTPIAQEIAKLALQEPMEKLKVYVNDVHEKQILLTENLGNIDGVSVIPAGGGTYVFPKIDTNVSDGEIARYLLKNHGIFVTPGSAYGPDIAPGHLRFVTLATNEALLKGVKALAETIKEIR